MNKKRKCLKSKEKELLPSPKNDIVFHSIFNEKNPEVTKAFIEDLIGEKVEKIKINTEQEIEQRRIDDKSGILDLQAEVNDKEKIDVEVQLVKRKNFEQRLLYYWARLYSDSLQRGDDYKKCKRIKIIAIVDYEPEVMKGIKDFEITFELRNEKKPNIILTKEIEISIISLKRIEEAYKEDKNNKKVQWMMFFNNPNSEEVEEIMERNKAINDAQIIIHKMTPEESKRAREWREEKLKLEKYDIYEAGKDDGIEEGLAKGLERGKKEGLEKRSQSRKTGHS